MAVATTTRTASAMPDTMPESAEPTSARQQRTLTSSTSSARSSLANFVASRRGSSATTAPPAQDEEEQESDGDKSAFARRRRSELLRESRHDSAPGRLSLGTSGTLSTTPRLAANPTPASIYHQAAQDQPEGLGRRRLSQIGAAIFKRENSSRSTVTSSSANASTNDAAARPDSPT